MVAIEEWHAFFHPIRRRRTLQIVVEILLQADCVILLVRPVTQSVRLAVVVEQVDFLAQPAQRQEELQALVPWHGSVAIVLQNHHRSGYSISRKDGRILDESLWVLPDGPANAALRALILELARNAR